MEEQIDELAQLIIKRHEEFNPTNNKDLEDQQPKKFFIVGITGLPGSGKSTLTERLIRKINESIGSEISISISLDGWHYYRSELDKFEDPIEAHRRRGSPFTFNSESYLNFLRSLKRPKRGFVSIRAPSFSHSIKDPIKDSIEISKDRSIVIIEGLYTLLNEGEDWKLSSDLIDLGVLIKVKNLEIVRDRLVKRHVLSGICKDEIEAGSRADFNDLPNGEYLMNHMKKPDIIIKSITDPSMELPKP